jgi:hypothetical protein
MQANDAIFLCGKRRYIDPTTICETKHAGPSKLADDDDMLDGCKTSEEKNEK